MKKNGGGKGIPPLSVLSLPLLLGLTENEHIAEA